VDAPKETPCGRPPSPRRPLPAPLARPAPPAHRGVDVAQPRALLPPQVAQVKEHRVRVAGARRQHVPAQLQRADAVVGDGNEPDVGAALACVEKMEVAAGADRDKMLLRSQADELARALECDLFRGAECQFRAVGEAGRSSGGLHKRYCTACRPVRRSECAAAPPSRRPHLPAQSQRAVPGGNAAVDAERDDAALGHDALDIALLDRLWGEGMGRERQTKSDCVIDSIRVWGCILLGERSRYGGGTLSPKECSRASSSCRAAVPPLCSSITGAGAPNTPAETRDGAAPPHRALVLHDRGRRRCGVWQVAAVAGIPHRPQLDAAVAGA
jgi:hypothetical protein